MKRQDTVLRFRLLASRFSFQLMWVWAGIMLLGLGTMHYKQINGEKVKYTKEDMMPNPEITAKLVNWMHKLGLDQTVDATKPRR